jgi:hypothetical protein
MFTTKHRDTRPSYMFLVVPGRPSTMDQCRAELRGGRQLMMDTPFKVTPPAPPLAPVGVAWHPCRVGGAHLAVNGPQPRVSAVLLPADAQFNRLPTVQRIIIG